MEVGEMLQEKSERSNMHKELVAIRLPTDPTL